MEANRTPSQFFEQTDAGGASNAVFMPQYQPNNTTAALKADKPCRKVFKQSWLMIFKKNNVNVKNGLTGMIRVFKINTR